MLQKERCTPLCCSGVQCHAVQCSRLQCGAVCCNVLQCDIRVYAPGKSAVPALLTHWCSLCHDLKVDVQMRACFFFVRFSPLYGAVDSAQAMIRYTYIYIRICVYIHIYIYTHINVVVKMRADFCRLSTALLIRCRSSWRCLHVGVQVRSSG